MKSGHFVAFSAALLALGLTAQSTTAQPAFDYQQSYAFRDDGPPANPGPGGAVQALWNGAPRGQRAARFTSIVDASGNSVVVPAGYRPQVAGGPGACGPGYGGPGCGGPGYGGPGYGGPGYCDCEPGFCSAGAGSGPYGCGPSAGTCPPFPGDSGSYDLMGSGAMGIDQCGPHYFDARLEALFMSRKTAFDQNVNFTIDNQDPANIVLSSGGLEYDTEPGFRVVGRYDLGALSLVEFGYWGVFDFNLNQTAIDNDPPSGSGEGDLFSFYSGVFVTDPPQFVPANIVLPDGPNGQTERSRQQSIRMESDIQNVEVSYRRYWVGYHPRVSGTLLAGARFTRLTEAFEFSTLGSESLNYSLRTGNDLVGGQVGGDMWVCLRQGVRVGSEVKLGLYNNRYKVNTNINASSNANLIANPIIEQNRDDKPAFIFEWSIDLVVDLTPSWSARVGFETLTIRDVALAGNNFNTGSIYTNQDPNVVPPRVAFVNDDGKAVYNGLHAGAEYVW